MSKPILPLEPFSDQFICPDPDCGFLDRGNYCSNCGHKLRIPKDQIVNQLVNRLMVFGFQPYEKWLASNEEIADYHALFLFAEAKGKILCKEDQLDDGLKLQMVFILDGETGEEEGLRVLIKEYVKDRAAAIGRINKLPRKKRPVDAKFFLDSIRIYGIFIKDIPAPSGNIGQSSFKVRMLTKTGVWAGVVKKLLLLSDVVRSSFRLKIRADIAILNYNDGNLYLASKGLYDIVNHQAEVVADQTREYDPSASLKHTPDLLEMLYALIDAFRDYFKVMAQYVRNPSFFPALIAMRNVIPLKRIVTFYFTGLVCSITLPWMLSVGNLNANNLGLFSNLPPFLGDTAQLLVDLLPVSIACVIVHIVMRMYGRKGSLTTLLLCYLFFESFMQVLERPIRYLTGPYLYKLSNHNFQLQITVQTIAFGCIWFIAAYFIFPILFAVYGASRKNIWVAYLVVGFFFGFWASFIHSFTTAYNQARFGNEVDYHSIQVYYNNGATREDAIRLKDFLVSEDFGDKLISFQLQKDDTGHYVFREVINSDVKLDSAMREEFKEWAVTLSYRVFHGTEVKIQLCDIWFKTIEEIQMPQGSRLTVFFDRDYAIEYPKSWALQNGGDKGTVFYLNSADSTSRFNLSTGDLKDTATSLDAYMKLSESHLNKLYGKRIVFLQDTLVTHDNKPCRKLVYTLDNSPGMSKMRIEQYIWVHKRKAFVLSFGASADAADERTIAIGEVVMNSFSIRE